MSNTPLHFVKKPNYSRVVQNKVVHLKYALFDVKDDGKALEFREDLYYLHRGYGGMPEKIEAALDQQEVGYKTEVTLKPKEAFGDYQAELRMLVPKAHLPPEAQKVGARIEGEGENGNSQTFVVQAVTEQGVLLDGNHPYAGKQLRFVLEVLDIRDASAEELQRGYAIRLSA